MSRFIEDVVLYLVNNSQRLQVPSARLDFLPVSGDALAVWQQENPKIEREYINGSKILQGQFKVMLMAQEDLTNSVVNLQAISKLEDIGSDFEAMDNFQISEKRVMIQCEANMPTIVSREQNGAVVYETTITCYYKESK